MAWDLVGDMAKAEFQAGLEERLLEDVVVPDIPSKDQIHPEDLARLSRKLNLMTECSTPWRKVPVMLPNLTWYTPTCTDADWRHQDVELKVGQGIAYVILNRPDHNNTLNDTIMHGLMDAVWAMQHRPDIRVVVFMAKGKIFSAGSDPQAMRALQSGTKPQDADGSLGRHPVPKTPMTEKVAAAFAELCHGAKRQGAFLGGAVDEEQVREALFWQTMTRMPQVTVCLVQGSVMGAGLGLVACTDQTIALEGSYFCVEDLKHGRVPAIVMPHLCQKFGPSLTRMMILTASNISADEAKTFDMVQDVVANEAAGHAKVATICEAVTQCGPRSVESCKELVNGVAGNPITEKIMLFTASMLAKVTVSDEAAVSMVALQAKQPKPWEATPIKPLF